jgi:Domain of unknown function (DUF1843)
MATTKKSTKKSKKSAKKSTKKVRASVPTGQVPPYGEVIRGAIARGDMQGMRTAAANARKWVADVQSALAELERAMKK